MIGNRLRYINKLKTKDNKRRYRGIKYPDIPVSSNDVYAITSEGDRLDLLANQFYGDIRLWWIIASANRDIIRRDSYAVKSGLEIRIPVNVNLIIKDFESINKLK